MEQETAEPVRLIYDTDMGNDIDDAMALAVIHALQSRGECRLLAVTVSKDNFYAAAYCDLLNHWYGTPGIPIGIVRSGPTPEDGHYVRQVCEARDRAGCDMLDLSGVPATSRRPSPCCGGRWRVSPIIR